MAIVKFLQSTSKKYSLVVNDITFNIILLKMIHFVVGAKVVNVKWAILHGELEEDIFMDCPFGMKGFGKDDCVIFVKWIYGLFVEVMQYKKGIRKFEESKLCCWQCQPMPLYEEMCREYSKSSFSVYDHIRLGTLRQ